jgi:hypothetical protein
MGKKHRNQSIVIIDITNLISVIREAQNPSWDANDRGVDGMTEIRTFEG